MSPQPAGSSPRAAARLPRASVDPRWQISDSLWSLCRELLGAPLDPRSRFDLQIAMTHRRDDSPDAGLIELTRDLAEAFKRGIAATPQFEDIVDRVECLAFDRAATYIADALELRWRI